ncbi:Protein SMG7 [Quillaja saponaria]|uniref:Protein SMG7 n=1 Tax=Quillaja saponaria TaxID=32244 RepID=A0AAD7LVF3_QUISA|nr:Protein SMG7 [Quillaja saponaria]
MDKISAPPRERAQRLYEKNIELESKRRRSAQARVPSDPNAWQQMRENYEVIILEDPDFSEKHNIDYALWLLHYKRIEELRGHFNSAHASTVSPSSQGVKGPTRPDRVTKIRMQFKTFLSEASGFFHDLIVKIRAKYGIPLDYFSEGSENRNVMEKDGKKSADMKKGLFFCHRCYIYLGDLARYKGLYGEGDSKDREYATASSYYLQAASLWPSGGNPHHQLAILASYAGDDLVAFYRYFRSLAVDSPFTTARDNLIVAFEKNRQNYCQLPGDVKVSAVKESRARLTGKGRGKVEAKITLRDTSAEAGLGKQEASNIHLIYKFFRTRFVRLNGILFTRTSLETFAEVLSLVSNGLRELLSSGPEEGLNFGSDVHENGLFVVRVISILIFTVHNVIKEAEGQTYAEIVQRAVLLQNSFTAAFELVGHIMERCSQLHDPSSSYLLPGILVFVEWLACCPDLASGNDTDENQATVRSKFWYGFISFLNKLLSSGAMPIEDDEEETCFHNMSRYEEGETENRLALWEDFELRGFVPLLPAQTILDFSRKHFFGGDVVKERKARLKRIFAAGKSLANVVRVDKQTIYFNSKVKKFMIGVEPQRTDDLMLNAFSGAENVMREIPVETTKLGFLQPKPHLYIEGEEEDEVIVFKPIVVEKQNDVVSSKWAPYEGLKPIQNASGGDPKFNGSFTSAPLESLQQIHMPLSVGGVMPQPLHPIQARDSRWLEEEASLVNSLKGLRVLENGHSMKYEVQESVGLSNSCATSVPIRQYTDVTASGMLYGLSNAPDAVIPSKIDAIASFGATTDNMALKTSSALHAGLRKSPVSRPARHLGPPPGFSFPVKQVNESSGSDLMNGNLLLDDYSWLDGYKLPSSTKSLGPGGPITYSHINSQQISNSNGLSGTGNFPFPGKQVPPMSFQVEKQNGQQDYQTYDYVKAHHEQHLQPLQLIKTGDQHFPPMPEQFQGNSIWTE